MIIECPHCKHDNEIEQAEQIRCIKCEKDYKGFTFSKRKWLATGTIIVGVAFGIHTGKEHLLHDNTDRYPLEVEYAFLDSCVNASNNLHTISGYQNKRERCVCAMTKTQKKISYAEASKNPNSFKVLFETYARSCS
ncbi:hypothetical protein [Shewanella cyperi]|uniref:hypothetical protein n=1 Tax=Shewanella cyperi TaxID=2814292 RepID=UPI001A944949|nr:hypothetical protein [Shewanella cyperi]QSX39781.1 hypothetical protein JYB84_12250 [Shewanella cyperi]